ncbi:hypothetical protein [Cupriavidus necator]
MTAATAAPAPSASPAALTDIVRDLEKCHTGQRYGDDKRGGMTEYTRGFGDCLAALKRALLAASPADQLEDARKLLTAASHALRSYQYGNAATDLAESIADRIDAAMSASKEGESNG